MPNPFDILQQRMKSSQPPPTIESSSIEQEAQVSLALNARMCITAPPGYVLCSVDYRNQELFVAAMESDDEIMQLPFSINTPMTIKGDDGIEYPNPNKDLHTLTTVACEPDYFDKTKPWTWDAIARDKNINPYVKGEYCPVLE